MENAEKELPGRLRSLWSCRKNKNLDFFEPSEKAIVVWIKESGRKGEEK